MPRRTIEAQAFDGVVIAPADPAQPEILAMLAESDAWYAANYPAESNHLLDVATLKQPNVAFFAARRDESLLGCGALVEQCDERERYGEIKRMYVAPAARGLGIGRRLLQTLEQHAAGLGLDCIRLETGVKQPEAIGLYRAFGYGDIGPFGDYVLDPLSVFMEKRLTTAISSGGRSSSV
jgi:putative acetyltransferase